MVKLSERSHQVTKNSRNVSIVSPLELLAKVQVEVTCFLIATSNHHHRAREVKPSQEEETAAKLLGAQGSLLQPKSRGGAAFVFLPAAILEFVRPHR